MFSMIKVFSKGQVTSLASSFKSKKKKKNLDTSVNYSIAFTLYNIKTKLGMGKSSISILSLSSSQNWCYTFVNHLFKTMVIHHFCIINMASIFIVKTN